jgi:hypothetical protein
MQHESKNCAAQTNVRISIESAYVPTHIVAAFDDSSQANRALEVANRASLIVQSRTPPDHRQRTAAAIHCVHSGWNTGWATNCKTSETGPINDRPGTKSLRNSSDRLLHPAAFSSCGVLCENLCAGFTPLAKGSAYLSLRHVNLWFVLTSQDRHEVRHPDVRDFTSHLNSSVFFEAGPGCSLATRKDRGYYDTEALP